MTVDHLCVCTFNHKFGYWSVTLIHSEENLNKQTINGDKVLACCRQITYDTQQTSGKGYDKLICMRNGRALWNCRYVPYQNGILSSPILVAGNVRFDRGLGATLPCLLLPATYSPLWNKWCGWLPATEEWAERSVWSNEKIQKSPRNYRFSFVLWKICWLVTFELHEAPWVMLFISFIVQR